MTNKVLVTYASGAGSTIGVADAIHQTLANAGLNVDLRPMQTVDDITPYTAVVAGSAIRWDRWLPEAVQFIKRHQTALRQKPFAAFLVCMAMSVQHERQRKQALATASGYLKPIRAMVPTVSEGLFAGTLTLSKLPLLYQIPFKMVILTGLFKEGDYRDWDAIQRWAEKLPDRLQQMSA